jgi:cytochrome P450
MCAVRHVDFLSPELGDKLWAVFAEYRRNQPVLWVEAIQMYCVFGYRDIRTCLTGPEFTVEYPFRVSRQVFGRTLLDMDGPTHVELRRLLGRLLLGREGNPAFVDLVDDCTARVLDALADRPEFEFVESVARRLPESVTARFLGIPAADRDWVFAHLRYLLDHLDGSSRDFASAGARRREVCELVVELLRGGATAEHSVIAQLAAAIRAGTVGLSDAVGLVLLVLAAGVETSTGMLANTMVALARFPQWRDRAAGDRDELAAVIREVVRWQPPQMDTVRFARAAAHLGGVPVPAGSSLKLLLGSGNRDEAVFSHPEAFRPDRPERAGLSFGHGAHSCLGMNLAIGVATRFFGAFLARFPQARVAGPVPEITGWTFRRPVALPMRPQPIGPAPAAVHGGNR